MNEHLVGLISAIVKAISPILERLAGLIKRSPRKLKTRAEARRAAAIRRTAPAVQRLRTGLWFQYHRHTRSGEFEPIVLDAYRKARIQEALWPELNKCVFKDRYNSAPISADHALNLAIDSVWKSHKGGKGKNAQTGAIYVIEAIAENLCSTFDVRYKDRRDHDRREKKGEAT